MQIEKTDVELDEQFLLMSLELAQSVATRPGAEFFRLGVLAWRLRDLGVKIGRFAADARGAGVPREKTVLLADRLASCVGDLERLVKVHYEEYDILGK